MGGRFGILPAGSENFTGNLLSGVVYWRWKELSMMDDMILNVNTLPDILHRRIRSDRVRVHEENGVFMLTPMVEEKKQDKPHQKFIGILSQESYDEINEALLDTQRVDVDEW